MIMTQEQLATILEKHRKWLNDEDGGECADLFRMDLTGANLRGADLRGANLRGANLRSADLQSADLQGANLRSADLQGANIDPDMLNRVCPICCPDIGAFIAWKKANGWIVKLQVTEDAKRSSATGRKCRCSKAICLAIEHPDGTDSELKEVRSNFDRSFVYRVGETVEVPDFDEDRKNECAPGIHFFITRGEAVNY